jgi:N-acetylneuraminic acid mutarotase
LSRRTAIVGLVISVAVLVLTVLVAAGPKLPGPPIRDWLGIGEAPLPDLCTVEEKFVREPEGKPGPGTWRFENPSPTPSPEPGAVALNGYVYMVGGQLRTGTESIVLRFDPRTGEYHREPDAPVAIDHPVVAAHDGELILASGYVDGAVSTPRMWSYSPRTKRWRELPPMRTVRGAAAGATIGDRLYVAGGVRQFGNEYQPFDRLEIYDFKTRRWLDGPDMPTARHHFGVAVVDGKLYAAGGREVDDTSLNSFEEFDPQTNRWRRLPPIPVGTGSPGVTALDGKVVVTGGGDEIVEPGEDGFILKTAYAYDPETGKWSRLPDLRQARHGHVAAGVDNHVYVFRGVPCPGYGEMASVESLPASAVR